MSRHRTTTPYADLKELRRILSRAPTMLNEPIDGDTIVGLGFTLYTIHNYQFPLRLRDFANAEQLDFCNAVGAIARHFDAHTRLLDRGFRPRFAQE